MSLSFEIISDDYPTIDNEFTQHWAISAWNTLKGDVLK